MDQLGFNLVIKGPPLYVNTYWLVQRVLLCSSLYTMKLHQDQVLLLLSILFFMIIAIFPSISRSRSIIEPCSTSHSCTSLLSYILPHDSKLSEIAFRFQVDPSKILSTNSINSTLPVPSISNQILRAKTLVKVPISCPCTDGIRQSMSTTHTVQAADTFDSISTLYGGLVSAQQMRSVNGINPNNPLMVGQIIVIPLPCTCLNGTHNGVATMYMSYVVQIGESLNTVAERFGSSVLDLEDINELQQPLVVPGDILSVPISECSSATLNWYNETTLVVPNGSYALTANNCIKCLCGPNDLYLRCVPSGMAVSCSHLQCSKSQLFIGDFYVNQTSKGYCNVSACAYRGHSGHRIFRSLLKFTNVQCPGNEIYSAESPMETPSSTPSYLAFAPSMSPSEISPDLAPIPTMEIDAPDASNASYGNKLILLSWIWLICINII